MLAEAFAVTMQHGPRSDGQSCWAEGCREAGDIDPQPMPAGDRIIRRERLGGMLSFYRRAAA